MNGREKRLRVLAPAKINLFLRVQGRRPDGYHNLLTWMQKVDLCDTLDIALVEGGKIQLDCTGAELGCAEDNLAFRAAAAFIAQSRVLEGAGVVLRLQKKIPIAAGLGGGSSDAGAVLRGLNHLAGGEFSASQLADMARPLGADVPFFAVDTGAVLASGRGDEMRPVASLQDEIFVLVNPGFSVSTKWVFENLSLTSKKNIPTLPLFREDGVISYTQDDLLNDLESVTLEVHPEAREIKKDLLASGASAALMSGSGPTVFGIYPRSKWDVDALQRLADSFRRKYGEKIFVVRACAGASPSGKAPGFDPGIRRFESCRPSHLPQEESR